MTAQFTHAGFAVVRTPLLPFERFWRWSEHVNQIFATSQGDSAVLLQTLRDVAQDELFREALTVATTNFSRELQRWIDGDTRIDHDRVLRTLVRYFSRATQRTTPFGLFAGCSLVEIANGMNLEISPGTAYRRRARLSMDYVASLSRTVASRRANQRRLKLRTNSTVLRRGSTLRYVETRHNGVKREYHLVTAEATPEILSVLDRAKSSATFLELSRPLFDLGYEHDEIECFLHDLLDAQLLAPDIEPILVGGSAVTGLAQDLLDADCETEIAEALREVDSRLRQLESSVSPDRSAYQHSIAALEPVQIKGQPSEILQVDLYKPAPSATLGAAVVEDAIEAAKLLLSTAIRTDPLNAFAKRFADRYEAQAVPLLEALDEEIGLGMVNPETDHRAALNSANEWRSRELVLADLRCRAERLRSVEVELTDEDIARLRARTIPAEPHSLAVFGTLVSWPTGADAPSDHRFFVSHAGGPSGARLLGRFAHLDPILESRLREYLADEEASDPERVFAEVVHLPQGRVGNVIARPQLRRYEIAYLGRGSASEEYRIDPADLLLSVREGRLRLYSKRLQREVRPRLTSAHNYQAREQLPVYRFLCAMQDHLHHGLAHWSWGAQEDADFLPRIVRGRVVLCSARWSISGSEISMLIAAGRRRDAHAIEKWRVARGVSSLALFPQGDQRFPVDFNNPVSAIEFTSMLKGMSSAALRESPYSNGSSCVRSVEGYFANEIVIPLKSASTAKTAQHPSTALTYGIRRSGEGARRSYAPGSEWTFCKIYCGAGTVDRVLRTIVAPLIEELRKQICIEKWFFLRYADPDTHIRLRFKTAPEDSAAVFTQIGRFLGGGRSDGDVMRLQLDTYQREIERYGGDSSIEHVETIFTVDSEDALRFIAEHSVLSSVPWASPRLVAAVGVDSLLRAADVPIASRVDLLSRVLVSTPRAVRQARSLQYRNRRRMFEELISRTSAKETEWAVDFGHAREMRLQPLFNTLHQLERAGHLGVPFEQMLLSLTHMWINRVCVDATEAEPDIYDALLRTYRAKIGRNLQAKNDSFEQVTANRVRG